jgi:hypothetical protein
MNTCVKKFYFALILSIMTFSFLQTPISYAAESIYQQKTLSFLSDVISLDLTKYTLTLLNDNVSSSVGGANQETIRYKLEAKESILDVNGVFRDGSLAWFTLYVIEGSPIYKQTQPANTIAAAKAMLQRYQTYAESNYQEMINVLDKINDAKSATVTSDNMILEISNDSSLVSLLWFYKYGDLEKPGLEIVFRDGSIETFNNQWNLLNVGSSTVNISKEDSIKMAKSSAANFSWKVGLDPTTAIEVKDFTILETPVQAELSFQVRNASTLYPFWRIELGLDKLYPGGVRSIAVGIWADTGEIRYLQELAYGGDLSNVTTTSAAPTLSTPPSSKPATSTSQVGNIKTASLDMTLLTAIIAAIICSVAIAIVITKRKSK